MHNTAIDVTWDPKKAETNFRKHRIRFSDAETVPFDPLALIPNYQDVDGKTTFCNRWFRCNRLNNCGSVYISRWHNPPNLGP
ncbi:MAG: BrnT family toxin [Desulfobacterales bacterium]|nr:MAG: BrnT family toxin [Desulfobacterales bacterium]